MKTSLQNARFWVRPYEFEGDGSTGAAEDVASLEFDGQLRTFWLKRLEGRLFFREVGRGEDWTFGALEVSDEVDLPSELARALESGNYGRVVLTERGLMRPHCLLMTSNERFLTLVPKVRFAPESRWKPQQSARVRRFLDWPFGVFTSIVDRLDRPINQNLWATVNQTPPPLIEPYWVQGSQAEWERATCSFFVCRWSNFFGQHAEGTSILWELQSASAMAASSFRYFSQSPSSQFYWHNQPPLSRSPRRLLRYIQAQFSFVGQTSNRYGQILPTTLNGIVSTPTHHETLEAQLFLRDWIKHRVPPAQARRWLDFS